MHAYIRLIRIDKPTGIWLLLWPCWWSVALASNDLPSLKLLGLFAAGAVVMRSAGCIFNDMVDRDFDKHVERTRTRPIASGEVSRTEAAIVLAVLLFIALDIVLEMPHMKRILVLAALSLLLVAAYPFMKRMTWWPQAFLGLTFNWGALMGWAAVSGSVGLPALLLYIGGIAWTLGYDTIYAHQDKEDDIKIGVKSTALKLGSKSPQWIAGFYMFALVCWVLAGFAKHSGWPYYMGLVLVAGHFIWQMMYVKYDDAERCLYVFRSNAVLGWLFFAGLWADGLRAVVHQL